MHYPNARTLWTCNRPITLVHKRSDAYPTESLERPLADNKTKPPAQTNNKEHTKKKPPSRAPVVIPRPSGGAPAVLRDDADNLADNFLIDGEIVHAAVVIAGEVSHPAVASLSDEGIALIKGKGIEATGGMHRAHKGPDHAPVPAHNKGGVGMGVLHHPGVDGKTKEKHIHIPNCTILHGIRGDKAAIALIGDLS